MRSVSFSIGSIFNGSIPVILRSQNRHQCEFDFRIHSRLQATSFGWLGNPHSKSGYMDKNGKSPK